MTDFAHVWHFTRFRLNQAIEGLTDQQIQWRMNANTHTIAEIVYHIAGAEHYWATRMTGADPNASEFEARIDQAVHDGFLKEGSSPFGEHEMNRQGIQMALDISFQMLKPVIENPAQSQLEMELLSPVGDVVSGQVGLSRVAQHAGYHTGQIWMIRMSPDFPDS